MVVSCSVSGSVSFISSFSSSFSAFSSLSVGVSSFSLVEVNISSSSFSSLLLVIEGSESGLVSSLEVLLVKKKIKNNTLKIHAILKFISGLLC